MGLLSAISNAVSGLSANQQNLNVLSQNISNANTPGYSNEVANQQATFVGGQGTGVSIESITRTVNQFLNSEMQAQTTTNSTASTIQSYYSQIENLLGTPGSSDSIDTAINSFFTAAQDLANSPSLSAQTNVVDTATSAASQISGLANSVYGLQLQTDNDINSAISSVNADLKSLQTINSAFEQASATSQNISGLEDQRDSALSDLAQYIDIKPTIAQDGAVTLNTTAGITLLTGSTVAQLSYNQASSTQTFATNAALSPIEVTQLNNSGTPLGSPVALATGGTATSVTTSLTGGKIAGLLTVRDSILPNLSNQLDQLASTLRDSVNAISNKGVSYPPPNSYTGTRLIAASSTSQYSGSVQIAVLGSDRSPIASPYADEPNGMPPLTLNLATLNTGSGEGVDSVSGIINAINQYYGPPQNKLELGNLNNVQLAVASSNIPDTGNTLNLNFNLGNISNDSASFSLVGTPTIYAGDPSANVVAGTTTDTGFTTTVASGDTLNTGSVTGGTMQFTLNPTVADASTTTYYTVVANISTTDSSGNTITSLVSYRVPNNASNVQNNLIGATGQSGSGKLVAPTTTQAIATASLVDANGNPLIETNGSYGNQQGYLKIAANGSTETLAINEMDSKQLGLPYAANPQPGTNQGFSQYFGLNNFFNSNSLTSTGDTVAGSAANLSVESRIIANPALISTATLSPSNQPTDSTSAYNFTYQVSSGDNSISQDIAGLASTLTSFNAAGGMPPTSTTFAQYAGQIIAVTSTNSSTATNTANDAQSLLSGYTAKAQAASGVNLDQELANTVVYQNAYSASTRIITVVSQMFTDLLSIIQ